MTHAEIAKSLTENQVREIMLIKPSEELGLNPFGDSRWLKDCVLLGLIESLPNELFRLTPTGQEVRTELVAMGYTWSFGKGIAKRSDAGTTGRGLKVSE